MLRHLIAISQTSGQQHYKSKLFLLDFCHQDNSTHKKQTDLPNKNQLKVVHWKTTSKILTAVSTAGVSVDLDFQHEKHTTDIFSRTSYILTH